MAAWLGERFDGCQVFTSGDGEVTFFYFFLFSSPSSIFLAQGRARLGSWGCGEGKGEGGSGQGLWFHKLWSRHGEMVKNLGVKTITIHEGSW